MDAERRAELEKKREKLKAAAEARSRAALIADLTTDLDAQGIEFQLELADTSWEWVCDHFPVNHWGGIDWALAARKVQYHWGSEEQRPELVKQLINAAGLEDGPVTVIWSNADRPAVLMSLGDVEAVSLRLLDQDFDTWMISKESKWCIECHHDGRIGIVLA
ncbi:hypothetical protein EB809_12775 [Marinobacter sp. R17]|uniref:hypothetical protein n=1 Tax=Marinobacter sp. R17 TaxID=2484250 RepID=UPI000F4BB7A0|nr:hypothetical protein [Marinobacter sp. R17]ROT98920.1 hypothetical protein EB809_12775 [Marinobacter sp. R17]